MNKTNRIIIQEGFILLKSKKNYKQVTVLHKLRQLNFFLSKPSFSNILTGKHAGSKVLWNAAKGIQQLYPTESGLRKITIARQYEN